MQSSGQATRLLRNAGHGMPLHLPAVPPPAPAPAPAQGPGQTILYPTRHPAPRRDPTRMATGLTCAVLRRPVSSPVQKYDQYV